MFLSLNVLYFKKKKNPRAATVGGPDNKFRLRNPGNGTATLVIIICDCNIVATEGAAKTENRRGRRERNLFKHFQRSRYIAVNTRRAYKHKYKYIYLHLHA